MRFRPAVFSIVLSMLTLAAGSAATKKTGFTVPVVYTGGTLPLNPGKIKVVVGEDAVILVHGNQRVSIPMENITAISSGTDVRRRFGASVLGVVPLMHLDKAETHYIGLTWTGAVTERTSRVDAVLKLNGGEYRDFLAMLERLTGRKATDPSKTATVVRYEL
jgi:hypothetical protein